MKKKLLLLIPGIPLGLVLLVLLFFGFLTIIEYRPGPIDEVSYTSKENQIETGKDYKLMTWNIGYAGLGKNEDFFMDGGKKVQPDSKQKVQNYFDGIKNTLAQNNADILFIQEIDTKSKRSYKINQVQAISDFTKMGNAFAINYKCLFVPFPLPPIGLIESGVSTFSSFKTTSAQRYALPCSFKWPVRIANLKRCMLVERLPVYENGQPTGKELVLVNFHLEAYDNGEGKIAQTKVLVDFITEEYAKGNYVIAGGDFNQRFPMDTLKYPIVWPDGWQPGNLDENMLPPGWSYAVDYSNPTCRSVEFPYNDERAATHNWQYYVIDGFLLSPNVKNINTKVDNRDFENSDHNPVVMLFELK
ncbi:MAG: endonuclease/exonuclease/phosphatase family protein [Treponema sp.]|nr:endonuclease/exonuclease/phosphatase family protein [Treponema sp.]